MSARSIGTWHETSLHRDLKFSYAGKGGRTEVEAGIFVADGVNSRGEFIEVQTGSFAPLKEKARKFAAQGGLRVIYPVIAAKYIDVYEPGGSRLYRRKSPRRGTPWDVFNALIYAPELPLIPGVVIELAVADVAEERVLDGKGSWKRKGASIHDRSLLAVHERISLEKLSDYFRFVPFKKKEEFTTALLGEKAGIPAALARKTLYVLSRMGLVEKTGKRGNALVYQIAALKKKKPQGPKTRQKG